MSNRYTDNQYLVARDVLASADLGISLDAADMLAAEIVDTLQVERRRVVLKIWADQIDWMRRNNFGGEWR